MNVVTSACVWHSIYGGFDRKKNWMDKLETEYMGIMKLSYNDKKGSNRGCFAKLFSICKSDVVKLMMKRVAPNKVMMQ